jgi:diguanylate cyclase (GGDEF)-like protein
MPDPSGYSTDRVLAALLLALDEGVLVFDDQGVCRAANRRAAEIFGLDAAAVVGLARADLLARAAAVAAAPDALAPLALSGERTVVDPIALLRPSPRTVVWTSVPAGDRGRLDLIRDVTRERRAEAVSEDLTRRLEMESTHDDLTGLANLRRFDEECQREHRRAQREWISYAVARVDVDGMGGINERLGRAVGDELLKRIGDELKSSRREYDVVARWKDDEFVILLPRADLRALSRVLRRALDRVHAGAREVVPGVTVCVGAAIWTPPSAEGPADILRRAGDALAAARAKGPGKVDADLGTVEWKSDDSDGVGGEEDIPGPARDD